MTVYLTGCVDVDIYVDVNGQWVSGDRANDVVWSLRRTNMGNPAQSLKTWVIKRKTEQLFTEWNDRAEWGTLYFSAPSVSAHI